jgi:hypothetical protein
MVLYDELIAVLLILHMIVVDLVGGFSLQITPHGSLNTSPAVLTYGGWITELSLLHYLT